MSTSYDEIKNAALELPFEARAKLVGEILNSLESSQEEIDAAWRAEIERRVKEIEKGEVELIPGAQVMRELRNQLKR
ncbi:MAG TPA: addiction module protein [Pyrinomonadaceae bacterium]|nr:addiction module protein [Pyrinomonadaceae bacterium]